MCTGKSAYDAQKDQYHAEVANQKLDQQNEANVKNMKADQYEIDRSEANLSASWKTGAIQRNFGMEVSKFHQANLDAYASLAANYAGPTGTGSKNAGRAAFLNMTRQKSMAKTVVRHQDIAQTESINQTNRERLTMMSKAASDRGMPGLRARAKIAKPRGTGYFEQALGLGSTILGAVSGVQGIGQAAGMTGGLFGPATSGGGSDIRLKENIDQVGVSPSGHKIYEWSYKSAPNSRYRGVIAQEVMKIDPMAVTIHGDNMLGVFYDKIDVDMELVS